MNSRRVTLVLFLLLAGVFGFGLLQLFELRFSAGDVYPAYSTLRADPLGTRAYYESVALLPGYRTARHYRDFDQLDADRRQTICLLGLARYQLRWLDSADEQPLDDLLRRGHRVVITFAPEDFAKTNQITEARPPRQTVKKKKAKPGTNEVVAADHRWGCRFANSFHATNDLWRSTLYFDKLDPAWTVLATRNTNFPAVIERKFGAGRLVLCADSYFVSNEALRRDRQTELLAAVLGPPQPVVFDETHLGVAENPGVMTLARRYRLHGLLAGLLVLAGLFIWQNASSFIPPLPAPPVVNATGRDSAAGFVNLLRRSIPASRILTVCVEQWRAALGRPQGRAADRVARIETIAATQAAAPPRRRNPVTAYREMVAIWKERK
jgi:hypothetical protein